MAAGGANDVQVVGVVVVEICFTDPTSALTIAAALVDEHPVAIYRVLTDTNLKGGTSVLHLHVRREMLDEVYQQPSIKGARGAMLVAPSISTN